MAAITPTSAEIVFPPMMGAHRCDEQRQMRSVAEQKAREHPSQRDGGEGAEASEQPIPQRRSQEDRPEHPVVTAPRRLRWIGKQHQYELPWKLVFKESDQMERLKIARQQPARMP